MRSRILIALTVFVLAGASIVFLWARGVLGTDAVRSAIASQISRALGQPVTIGSIDAGIFPRISVDLGDVTIGDPPRVRIPRLEMRTGLGALLFRRVEHASLHAEGARIELPFPLLSGLPAGQSSDGAPLEIVSIDDIVLTDVEIVSGGRTLRGDIEASVDGPGLELRSAALMADGASFEASGRITDRSGPVGTLQVKADALSIDHLLVFAAEFARGVAQRGAHAASVPATSPSRLNLEIALDANRATFGLLTLEGLGGRAVVTARGVTLDPLSFGLFDGRYDGTVAVAFGDEVPSFRWTASLSDIDVGAATRSLGDREALTGRLDGTMDVAGRGADAGSAIRTARGRARVDVTDGIVPNLGLVRSIVIATSMRSDTTLEDARGPADEPFSRLGATLAIANGGAHTDDLRFESENLTLTAAGALRLDGSHLDLAGEAQLSEALSQKGGRDLLRYTRKDGRVTLPVTIGGPASAPVVGIDPAEVAKRAILNRALEEAERAIEKGLGGLLGK